MVICAVVVIGLLVIIHEGGHFLAAKAFGVRVTELMVGLPGPNIGFKKGGTKFGITAVPLGGYAKVCGMETGDVSEHIKSVLVYVYRNGTVSLEEIMDNCCIDRDDAVEAVEELIEWGSITASSKVIDEARYMTPEAIPAKSQIKIAKRLCMLKSEAKCAGEPRDVDDPDELYLSECRQQYRFLPLWKKTVILLAGIAFNILFAILAFVVIYSVVGIDAANPQTGEIQHIIVSPLQAIQAGFNCIAMTFGAIVSLFNPQTAAETVSNSTSIVGIAVMSADYFAQGFTYALFFMAIVSVSLGLMNLLPIPPLDGGRFVIEVIQKITRRNLSTQALGAISMVGMALFLCFFVFMLNQDIQRFVFGNW